MPSLVIRPASITDIPSISKIRSEALTEQEISGFSIPESSLYYSEKKLMETWDTANKLKDDSEVSVAVFDGIVIGFIVFNMNNCDDNIDNVVVARKEQGKGVGRALVEYIEELAKSRGMDVITTDTTENAEGSPWKAYGFWKKMGYEDTGKRLTSGYDFKVIPLVKKLN
jgi:ribosomal protein S18 acetylase RimI-like enzyme